MGGICSAPESPTNKVAPLDNRDSIKLSPMKDGSQTMKYHLVETHKGDNIWSKYDKTNMKLGSGMSGSVYVIKNKMTGQEFACKSVFRSRLNKEIEQDLRTELNLLRRGY